MYTATVAIVVATFEGILNCVLLSCYTNVDYHITIIVDSTYRTVQQLPALVHMHTLIA